MLLGGVAPKLSLAGKMDVKIIWWLLVSRLALWNNFCCVLVRLHLIRLHHNRRQRTVGIQNWSVISVHRLRWAMLFPPKKFNYAIGQFSLNSENWYQAGCLFCKVCHPSPPLPLPISLLCLYRFPYNESLIYIWCLLRRVQSPWS